MADAEPQPKTAAKPEGFLDRLRQRRAEESRHRGPSKWWQPEGTKGRAKWDLREFFTDSWESVASWVSFDRRTGQPRDPGVGNAMRMTAPVAGKVLDKQVRKIPVVYGALGPIFGGGGEVRDVGAMVGIPMLVGAMERDPASIPRHLPKVRYLMRPVIREMIDAAKREKAQLAELREMEAELREVSGEEMASIDHMILVGMLGLSPEEANRILSGQHPTEVLAHYYQPPEPEQPEQEGNPPGAVIDVEDTPPDIPDDVAVVNGGGSWSFGPA